MPGPVLHVGAVVQCSHGAPAMPTAPSPRVLVSAMPAATIVPPYTVIGCPFTGTGGGCVTGQWVVGAVRVKTMGQPLALQTGVGNCAPNGMPLVAISAQPRVLAT